MSKLTDVKGVIFDYGGTIDTNSRHWAEVLWSKYDVFSTAWAVTHRLADLLQMMMS